jgi:ribosome recycling factor
MDELKPRDDFAPEILRARVDAWVEERGRKDLVRTIKSAEQARESIRAMLRVDQQTLNNPVTL